MDDSLDDVLRDPSNSSHDLACSEINRLADARVRGRLLIYVDSLAVLDLIRNSERFSNRTKSVFLAVSRARAFKGSLVSSLKVVVRLVAGGGDVSDRMSSGRREIIVPICNVPHGFFDNPVLLAENINDAKAYLILARAAIASGGFQLPRVQLKADVRGGGGSAIEHEYKNIKSAADKLVLSIVDSDVRYPGCVPNDWSRRMVEDDIANSSSLARTIVIDVYSIENIFPLDLHKHISSFRSDPARRFSLERDEGIWRKHVDKDHWRFVPLKRSVPCALLRGAGDGGAYWQGCAQHFNDYSSKSCTRDIYACTHGCERLPRYPEDYLVEFVKEFEKVPNDGLRDLCRSLPASVRDMFAELSKSVVSWFCVGRPIGAVGRD
ncbi:hypothetical protein ISP17_14900 [Dyella ginsengisoli]|uniref:Uncharacterized protein n=1 Tax=Dyella ginsengisoli TaxID=363848 RepID=A0ABW8JVV1_9GAMM